MRNLILFAILALGLAFSGCQKENTTIVPVFNYEGHPFTQHEILFKNQTSSGTFISWNFGDGTLSTAQFGRHTYTTAGTYTVQMIIKDAQGNEVSTSQTINIAAAPTAIKIKKVTVGDIILTGWDSSSQTGPDMFITLTQDATTYIEINNLVINDVTNSDLPISWNTNFTIQNPYSSDLYTLNFYDDDGSNFDLMYKSPIDVKKTFAPYNKTTYENLLSSTELRLYTMEVEFVY